MRLRGKPANLGEDLYSFSREVKNEITSRETKLRTIQEHKRGGVYGHLISFGLISIMIFLMFQQFSVFIIWLLVAILLYSYNFIILFIPTTTGVIRPDDEDVAPIIIKERKWFAVRLLLKNRKLAIEIGLTVFLGGIVPLTLSFAVIFGLGIFFALYFGLVVQNISSDVMLWIVIQSAVIILFYVMMLIIEPQSQGITKIARAFKAKLEAARTKGGMAHLLVMLTLAGVAVVGGALVVGAMVLPGFLLPVLFNELTVFSINDVPMFILVFVSQLLIMRHFQVIMSRWMAIKLIRERVSELKTDVLDKLRELESAREGEKKDARLEDLKRKYYSIAIYDLIAHDIFGQFPVYLVGPRLRYVLDEDVIEHIKATPKKDEETDGRIKIVQGQKVEHWKLSIEGKKEGTRTEIHIPDPTNDKKE